MLLLFVCLLLPCCGEALGVSFVGVALVLAGPGGQENKLENEAPVGSKIAPWRRLLEGLRGALGGSQDSPGGGPENFWLRRPEADFGSISSPWAAWGGSF